MRLLVIGDPERKDQDMPLVKAGKKIFTESVYAPINSVRIQASGNNKAVFDSRSVTGFNCVVPIPTLSNVDMFLSLIHSIRHITHVPYTFESLMIFQKKMLAITILKELGYYTVNATYSISEDSLGNVRNFPLEISIGNKSMHIYNDRQFKSVLKMRQPGQEIFITELIDDPITECIVLGNAVIAAIEIRAGKIKKIDLDDKLKAHIGETARFLGTQYCAVTLNNNKIVSLSLAPDFSIFDKVTKKKISLIIVKHLKQNIAERMTVMDSIIDVFRRFV